MRLLIYSAYRAESTNSKQSKMAGNNEIILYQPDETIKLEVRLENETVWLTQQQMAELFCTQRQAITKHLKNIFDCEELERSSSSSILELLQKEGNFLLIFNHLNHLRKFSKKHSGIIFKC